MPLYEYECEKCGEQFEELVSRRNGGAEVTCPACGSHKTRRLQSTFALGKPGKTASSCTTCCPGGTCGL